MTGAAAAATEHTRHIPVILGDDLVRFGPVTGAADGLDEKVLSLAGEVVLAVRYFQLTSEVDDRSWERGQGLHVVDSGIDLVTGGSVYHLTWDRSPVTYSITLQDGSMVEELTAGRFYSVEDRLPWSLVKGESIARPRLHWTQDGRAERPFPVAISLGFGNGRMVVLAASNFTEAEAPLFVGGDEITIIWEPTTVSALLPEMAPDILTDA